MISSCRCYGVPDLLRVPSPSSCRMGPISKGSADTVLVLTLRFARCSFSICPGFEVCQCPTLIFPLECCSRWENGTTLSLPTHTRTHVTTLYISHLKTETTNNNETVWPKQWVKILNVTRLYHCTNRRFHTFVICKVKYHKHTTLKSLHTHCLPATEIFCLTI